MTWHDEIPKVELHVHLEGAIPHEALFELIQKYGGDPLAPDVSAIAKRFEYTDFPHFIDMWVWKNGYLREYDDLTLISELFARDMAEQNVCYAEVFYSPGPFEACGLTVQGVTEAVRRGLDRAPGTEIALICDFVRNHGPQVGADVLAKVLEVRDDFGVIGIGIGGLEDGFPPGEFVPVYDTAREAGLHLTAHAGEGFGPESIWGALSDLRVERIGHGVRAGEDPALVEYLAEHRVPLEMCPVSNVRTGVVPSLAEHPIRRFFDAGLLVTANSDDPAMFQTTIANEYRQLEAIQGWARSEICQLVDNAIEASWLPQERKAEMTAEFHKHEGWVL